jgi:hypothetical protein
VPTLLGALTAGASGVNDGGVFDWRSRLARYTQVREGEFIGAASGGARTRVGLGLHHDDHQLMTAGMVHVTILTPGSDNPSTTPTPEVSFFEIPSASPAPSSVFSRGHPRQASSAVRASQAYYPRRRGNSGGGRDDEASTSGAQHGSGDPNVRCVFNVATAQFSFALELASHLNPPGMTLAKSNNGVYGNTSRTHDNAAVETATEVSTALSSIVRWSRRCQASIKRELLILPASFQARRKALVPLRRRVESVVESLEVGLYKVESIQLILRLKAPGFNP